jgi:hypothetical protein
VTVQVPVPEQPPPDQPANTEPEAGAAASVTVVLASKRALHPVSQAIPAGPLVTVPLPPSCSTVTVSSGRGTAPYSYAPISGVESRSAPSMSSGGAPVVVPALIAGLPAVSW